MIEEAPIKFLPSLKSVIWGGTRICTYKGIPQPEANIGESWEISAIPGHDSVVESGVYAGRTLSELTATFGAELLGSEVAAKSGGRFPMIVKLIDANSNLSVQVHPGDELAMARHNCPGKTEMWYVIDSEKDARVYVGLNHDVSPEEYEQRVADGTFEDALLAHDSHAGDVFYLPAGRVHTIGPGNLVIEVQQASDITYRIYDFNRLDSHGQPRELHTELAREAIDYGTYDNYKLPAPEAEKADAELVACPQFRVNRLILDGAMGLESDGRSFTALMCIEGEAELVYPAGRMKLSAGSSVLCPAVMTQIRLEGKATLLYARAV